jgi:hypothetical protein
VFFFTIDARLFIDMSHPSAAIVGAKVIGFVIQVKLWLPELTNSVNKHAMKIVTKNAC